MQRSEDAAIPMQNNFNSLPIQWLVGDSCIIESMQNIAMLRPFEDDTIEFLNLVSKILLKNKKAKEYPEIITFSFWIRKASLLEQKRAYDYQITNRIGRGVVFHIAPSNVPVNFAYSLIAGLLAGNANIIKVPSKKFEQVEIILEAIRLAFETNTKMKSYITCIRYGHENVVNHAFSAIASSRVIWGGDSTIETIRQSPLPARANEITFSDRYSITVIDSDAYLAAEEKEKVINDFYNDTYLTDQNACTSPVLVFWIGENKEKSKSLFWKKLHKKIEENYTLQPVQSVAKYTKALEWAAESSDLLLIPSSDNLITRVKINQPSLSIIKNHGHSGLFLEYDAMNLDELFEFCNDTHCQTVSYYGDLRSDLTDFIFKNKPKGIDRIVPVGKTMNFNLVWDGIDLILGLSRIVQLI